MTSVDKGSFSINCRNFKDIIEDIKMSILNCYNSAKMCNLCNCFSCFTDKDFFIDLEKGSGNAGTAGTAGTVENMFNKEPLMVNGEAICVKCNIKKADVVIIPCGHSTFCNDCLEEWTETNQNCPTCDLAMTDVVQCI